MELDEIGSNPRPKKGIQPCPSDLDLTPAQVLALMAKDADPVTTGFAPLDTRLRRGGIPPGRVISVGGPPFAGKTTLVADIALHVSKTMPVFALFSDEGRTQAAMRIGVMMGLQLEEIDDNPEKAATKLGELMDERSIFLRKPDDELATAEDLFDHAHKTLGPGVHALIILDSIQTIPARRDMDEDERQAYKAFMKLCRDKASEYGYIVLLTSQSNRASYRNRKTEENSVAIASFSGSAAIEFLSDVALVLSLPDENSEIVRVQVVKNRLVNVRARLPKAFHVKYQPESGRMVEVDEATREEANMAASKDRLRPVSDAIRSELGKGPELSGVELERRMRGKGSGFGTSSVRAAIQFLEADKVVTSIYREGKGGGYFYALR